jgi:hypothetical protein
MKTARKDLSKGRILLIFSKVELIYSRYATRSRAATFDRHV